MTKTMMRVNKKLLEQLKARKQVPRESYADVVERMIRNETQPNSIQKMLRTKLNKKPTQSSWNKMSREEKIISNQSRGFDF